MGGAPPAMGPARVLGELPDLRPGLDAGSQRAGTDHLDLCLGCRRGGVRRLPGPRAGRLRHAAGAGEDASRAACRPAIQGDPGVGRPARRRHHRARHGRCRRPTPARGCPPVRRAVGHLVRAGHPVRERDDARSGHACPWPGQAEPPGARAARPRAGPLEGQCRASPAGDHATAQCADRRPRRRSRLGRRRRNRIGAARAGARPR